MNYQKLLQQVFGATLITILSVSCATPVLQAAIPAPTESTFGPVELNATPETPITLKPRVIFPKPAFITVDPEQVSAGQIILKVS